MTEGDGDGFGADGRALGEGFGTGGVGKAFRSTVGIDLGEGSSRGERAFRFPRSDAFSLPFRFPKSPARLLGEGCALRLAFTFVLPLVGLGLAFA